MSTDFLRNYIDIIKEAEQPRVQLDEGMMDLRNGNKGNLILWQRTQQQQTR
jgi:hypothetical protein